MFHDQAPADDGIIFADGFIWERGFVKQATSAGRRVLFRISTQLVTNCLAPNAVGLDPIRAFTANDAAIQAACRHALERTSGQHISMLDVQRQDFEPHGKP